MWWHASEPFVQGFCGITEASLCKSLSIMNRSIVETLSYSLGEMGEFDSLLEIAMRSMRTWSNHLISCVSKTREPRSYRAPTHSDGRGGCHVSAAIGMAMEGLPNWRERS